MRALTNQLPQTANNPTGNNQSAEHPRPRTSARMVRGNIPSPTRMDEAYLITVVRPTPRAASGATPETRRPSSPGGLTARLSFTRTTPNPGPARVAFLSATNAPPSWTWRPRSGDAPLLPVKGCPGDSDSLERANPCVETCFKGIATHGVMRSPRRWNHEPPCACLTAPRVPGLCRNTRPGGFHDPGSFSRFDKMGEIYKYADLKGMTGFSDEGLTPIFHRFLMILLLVCMGSPLYGRERTRSHQEQAPHEDQDQGSRRSSWLWSRWHGHLVRRCADADPVVLVRAKSARNEHKVASGRSIARWRFLFGEPSGCVSLFREG